MKRMLFLLAFVGAPLAIHAAESPAAVFSRDIRPLLDRYCLDCHDTDTDTPFRVEWMHDLKRVFASRKMATKVITALQEQQMPPKKKTTQPSAAERQRIIDWINATRSDPALHAAADQYIEPGKVVMRRLNRFEYAKTVRDLFFYGPKRTWTWFHKPGDPFPEKGIEYSKRTFNLPWNLPPDEVDYGYDNIGDVLTIAPHLMDSYFEVGALVVDTIMGDDRARAFTLKVRPGNGRTEEQAAQENLTTLAMRAFRRPVTEEDVAPLMDLFRLAQKKGETFENAMKVPMQAILVSPDFLFRVEGGTDANAAHRALGTYELASRLSYFLWSSIPDQELFQLAAEGKLSDPAVIEQQVRRMLVDPKIEALAEHFAPQWLQIENIQTVTPDPMLFAPFYRRFLAGAMRTEAIIFFDSVVIQDRSIIDLIDSDTTYINAVLAEYYGVGKTKKGNNYENFALWVPTKMPETRQGGVLTMAAVGSVTSLPTRSSPVKRGKWVLEAILGDPPPPPPPNVEPLREEAGPNVPKTLREKFEQHRDNANCAACHQRMDPIGFAMENIDAIGRWRDKDTNGPIDATGTLKDGSKIDGTIGLKVEVLRQKDEFARCLTEQLMTYALGRKLDWHDEPAVDRIVEELKNSGYRFSTLAVEIAKSRPFRNTSVR